MYSTGFKKQGLYYGLKIMKSIIIPFELFTTKKSNTKFIQDLNLFKVKFLESNGFSLLCETLNNLEVKSILKDVVWLSIFQILIQILIEFLQDYDFVAVLSKNKKIFHKLMSKLISTITQVLSTVSHNSTYKRDLRDTLFKVEEVKTTPEDKIKNIIYEYQLFETNFSAQCIQLLSSCLSVTPKEADNFYTSDFIRSQGIINLLTFHPNKEAMKKFSESLFRLCKNMRTESDIHPNPAHFFIQLLQKDLKIVLDSKAVIHTEFFNLWDDLIRLVPNDVARDIINSDELAHELYDTIYNRPVIEDDEQQDYILSGSLRILNTLDHLFHNDLRTNFPKLYNEKFLNFLLRDALFERKRVEDINCGDSEMIDSSDTESKVITQDDASYPLCKHNETRKYAFKLVNQLFGAKYMTKISLFLESYIKEGYWRTNKRDKWYIHPSKLSHRKTHVGLVNLGCTCYMNSMMQQLFMSPHFRNFICMAKDHKKDTMELEDNVLYQAKYLFANLLKSKMPTFNPTALFCSVKDFGGQVLPTNEQRDVDEFFSMFLDQAEKNFVGTKDEENLKKIFGGSFAQQLICID